MRVTSWQLWPDVEQRAELCTTTPAQVVDSLYRLGASIAAGTHGLMQDLCCRIAPSKDAPPLAVTLNHPIENASGSYDVRLTSLGELFRNAVNGPGELEAALTSVSAVLGFRAGVYSLPQVDEAAQLDDEPREP